ncbi:glutathione S-transferase [Bermanella sp. 47_1433_sub80_T6]|nr:glutathione S-transferase [Bermanella sp. 47_1433_sub80_T6]
MYNLYYYPRNASMAPHFILNELAVDFKLTLVDRKTDAQKSAEYLAINPAGRIPALEDGGLAIFESAAICLHLAEQHPNAQLVPAIGESIRPKFFQWLMYLTNTLQAELMIYFYPENHTTNTAQHSNIVTTQVRRIGDILALLDNELKNKNYLVGEQLTVCDYYLLMLLVWCDDLEKPPTGYDNLANYLKNLAKRPAVKQVAKKENIDLAIYL